MRMSNKRISGKHIDVDGVDLGSIEFVWATIFHERNAYKAEFMYYCMCVLFSLEQN